MAHFAKLDSDNIVEEVFVINNDEMLDEDGVEQESIGLAILESLYGPGNYKQTSITSSIRGKFAGQGDKYDATLDKFIVMNGPYPSWEFNETTGEWDPPVAYPEGWNADDWHWDENAYDADNTTGWTQELPNND